MKKILLITVGLSFAFLSSAQFLRFGLTGGVSSSSVQVSDIVTTDDNTAEYHINTFNPTVGFHFGGFARITVSKFFLQPQVLFSSTGGEVKIREVKFDTTFFRNQRFNRVDIPVLAGYKLGFLRLEAGPVATFTLSRKNDLFDWAGYKEDFNAASIGYQAGLGVDLLKKITIDLKYEGSLSKLGKGVTIGERTYPLDSRTNQWIVSLGLFL
ncbi:MAG: porin family protein [Bacteroidales bacterium]